VTAKTLPTLDPIRDLIFRGISDFDSASRLVSFSGICKDYCVCIVDAVDSTESTAKMTSSEICKYYSIFLNSIAQIAKEFGASIVKNMGDSILYYFPKTVGISKFSFVDVLECGLEMLSSRSLINKKMSESYLPPISFKISADFGPIMKAKADGLMAEDIFGTTVNVCSKINARTQPNTMRIGSDVYQIVKSLGRYKFEHVDDCSVGLKHKYPVYTVTKQF
jgi:class 3 adenylate cyclase